MTEPAREQDLERADAIARERARTVFDRPFVLEAGAGTGKTTALVARLVAWCIGPGWERASAALGPGADPEATATRVLDRIAAITFTEAAAAEMAARAATAFAEIEKREVPRGLDARALALDGEESRSRARALLGHLDRLAVRTIHAFCRRLLSASPLEAGLHPGFEVDADGSRLAEVVREAVGETLRTGYAEPGDADLIALAQQEVGAADIETALLRLAAEGVPPEALAHEPFSPDWVEAARADLSASVSAFLAAEGGRYSPKSRAKTSSAAVAAVRAAGRSLGQHRGDDPSAATSLVAIARELAEAAEETLAAWAAGEFKKTDQSELGDALAEVGAASARLCATLVRFEGLDPLRHGQLRRALAPILGRVRGTLRARGIATFGDLLRDTRDLLERRADVRARIRASLDQLLVDEFQDTDATQCAIVRALALEAPEAGRPGLFLVGDPKQSIYAFRSADLAAYDAFLAEVVAAGGEIQRLSVNYRSVPAILAEVERIVRPIMRRAEGVQPEFQPLVASPDKRALPGFAEGGRAPVEHWVSWLADAATGAPAERTKSGEATAIEAEAVALDILDLHVRHGVPWKRFGLLLRVRGDLEVYLSALRDHGVPYAVGKDRSYYQRREIVEATAVLRAVLDPGDHVALVAWLRGPTVGVPDAALPRLWAGALPRMLSELAGPDPDALAAIASLARETAAALPAELPGIERIAGWELALAAGAETLAALRHSFAVEAPDRFIERLRAMTQLESVESARWLGHYRIANLDRFFRELASAFAEPGADLRQILRALRVGIDQAREADEARPREALENAVRVMTIHEAKGLDFGHVYLLQAHKLSRGRPGNHGCHAAELGGAWELELFGSRSPGYHGIRERRRRNEAAERVRTLYVALTRAEERLVVAGNWPASHGAESEDEAQSYIDLLQARVPERPPLAELGAEAALRKPASGDQGPFHADRCQARWVFPGLGARRPRATLARSESPLLPGADEVRRAAAALARERDAAHGRMARRLSAPASEAAHEALRDALTRDGDEPPAMPRPRPAAAGDGVARAVGTAIHRALETWVCHAPIAAELERQLALLGPTLAALLPGTERARALASAAALLERIARGNCLARLVALAPRIVARELPLLLAPDDAPEAPVGFVSGAVDMVYRDPGSDQIVIVDYKTDAVDSAAEIATRTEVYARQGAVYVRGVREALGLDRDPRFELWFLAADHIEPVD